MSASPRPRVIWHGWGAVSVDPTGYAVDAAGRAPQAITVIR
jgi:hypothetical protein